MNMLMGPNCVFILVQFALKTRIISKYIFQMEFKMAKYKLSELPVIHYLVYQSI